MTLLRSAHGAHAARQRVADANEAARRQAMRVRQSDAQVAYRTAWLDYENKRVQWHNEVRKPIADATHVQRHEVQYIGPGQVRVQTRNHSEGKGVRAGNPLLWQTASMELFLSDNGDIRVVTALPDTRFIDRHLFRSSLYVVRLASRLDQRRSGDHHMAFVREAVATPMVDLADVHEVANPGRILAIPKLHIPGIPIGKPDFEPDAVLHKALVRPQKRGWDPVLERTM